jgi:hypothetical protein
VESLDGVVAVAGAVGTAAGAAAAGSVAVDTLAVGRRVETATVGQGVRSFAPIGNAYWLPVKNCGGGGGGGKLPWNCAPGGPKGGTKGAFSLRLRFQRRGSLFPSPGLNGIACGFRSSFILAAGKWG